MNDVSKNDVSINDMIRLKINGKDTQVETNNLQQLLDFLQKNNSEFAVALNEVFISKKDYFKTQLNQGDQIEIVQPMQGG